MNWLALFLRFVLGAVFIYAGLVKASASEGFVVTLLPFIPMFPLDKIEGLALFIACIEVVAGTIILLPRIYFAGAAMIVILCLIFIGALTWALANGIIINCGCFGFDEAPSATKMFMAVARDIVLAMAALFILVKAKKCNVCFSKNRPTESAH